MSALAELGGRATVPMTRDEAYHALIELGLVHAALDGKTRMDPEEMMRKLKAGANAILHMNSRIRDAAHEAEMAAQLTALRPKVKAQRLEHA